MAKATRYTPELVRECFDKGYWEPTTFSDLWDRNARECPDKEAVTDSESRLTWSQANLAADRLALGLMDMGLKKDDMIILQLPNSLDLFLLRIACEKAGILCMPVLRTYREREISYFIEQTRAAAIAIPLEFRGFNYLDMVRKMAPRFPHLKHILISGDEAPAGTVSVASLREQPIEKRYPRDLLQKTKTPATEFSLVLLTTGSTGTPKFVESPICATMCRERALVKKLGFTGEEVYGILSPVGGGVNSRGYYGVAIVAGKTVIQDRFEAEDALRLIEKEGITFAFFAPAQLALMLKHPNLNKYDLSSLRLIWTGSAPVPPDLAVEAEKKLCKIIQGYSSIDCSVTCIPDADDPMETRLFTAGKPYAFGELKLRDDEGKDVPQGEVGEVWLRGPAAASGYFNDPETTWNNWTKDGWFRMGDLGKLDQNGNLVLVGRKKEVINRGGQKIFPTEVEDLLSWHPKVATVALVGMPDPVMGEKACAYVVPKPNQTLTLKEMLGYLAQQGIAAYKLPERLEIVEKMPLVGDGMKIDKKALMKDVSEKLKTEVKI